METKTEVPQKNGMARVADVPAAQTTALTPFEPQGMEQAMRLADQLSKSNLLPGALRGKPADVLVTLLTGRELGLSPLQSMRGIYVVEGKPTLAADAMVALVKRHPDACEWFRLIESTPQRCTYETKRRGEPEPTRLTFSLEDAQRAGVAGKDNWKKYPAAMLRARCSSALCRAVYPDLLFGVFDPEEMERSAPAAEATQIAIPRDVTPPPAPAVQAPPDPTVTDIDPVTGEVLEPAPAEQFGNPVEPTPEERAEYLRTAIADAATLADLQSVAQKLAKEAKDVRDALRPAYARRQAELTAAAKGGAK